MGRSALLRDVAAVLVLAVGGVLALIAALVFGFEVALATFVATLTLATAATVARLILTDDVSQRRRRSPERLLRGPARALHHPAVRHLPLTRVLAVHLPDDHVEPAERLLLDREQALVEVGAGPSARRIGGRDGHRLSRTGR